MFKTIVSILNPWNCRHHEWGNPSVVNSGKDAVKATAFRNNKIVLKKKHKKRCQHDRCNAEKTYYEESGAIAMIGFNRLQDTDKWGVVRLKDVKVGKKQKYSDKYL